MGLLHYDTSRSQSILRVASTASPVSGTEVRDQMLQIGCEMRRVRAVSIVQRIWRAQRMLRWIRDSASIKRNATLPQACQQQAQFAAPGAILHTQFAAASGATSSASFNRRARYHSHDVDIRRPHHQSHEVTIASILEGQ